MTRGTLLALAAVLTLGSCRGLTGPRLQPADDASPPPMRLRDDAARGAARPGMDASDEERAQVPVVTRIEAAIDQGGVHFRLHLAPERPGERPFYGPRSPGGWQFQAFLDVDRDGGTGYGPGFEFLTRDSEADLAPGTVVLRRTEGGGGPGGWGDEVARLPVRVFPRLMAFTIPNVAIEDDGLLDFSIDFYATVLGGPDGATPVARYVRDVRGSSVPRRRDDRSPVAPGPAAAWMAPFGAESPAGLPLDRRVTRR